MLIFLVVMTQVLLWCDVQSRPQLRSNWCVPRVNLRVEGVGCLSCKVGLLIIEASSMLFEIIDPKLMAKGPKPREVTCQVLRATL